MRNDVGRAARQTAGGPAPCIFRAQHRPRPGQVWATCGCPCRPDQHLPTRSGYRAACGAPQRASSHRAERQLLPAAWAWAPGACHGALELAFSAPQAETAPPLPRRRRCSPNSPPAFACPSLCSSEGGSLLDTLEADLTHLEPQLQQQQARPLRQHRRPAAEQPRWRAPAEASWTRRTKYPRA